MYSIRHVPVIPRITDQQLALPIRILLCLTPRGGAFNLPGAIHKLIGGSGWDRATRVFAPFVYAPSLSWAELSDILGHGFEDRREFSRGDVNAMRVGSLSSPRFDIVHAAGTLKEIDRELPRRTTLRRLVRDAATRLLILQVPPEEFDGTASFAQEIVGDRGPAVLAAACRDGKPLAAYLLNVYAGIVHNQTLTYATQPKGEADVPNLFTHFVHGTGGEDLLRLDPLVAPLEKHAHAVWSEYETLSATLKDLPSRSRLLHASQLRDFEALGGGALEHGAPQKPPDDFTYILNNLEWAKETGGAIPVADVIHNLRLAEQANLDLSTRLDRVRQQVRIAAETAPRVLNANFADARNAIVGPMTPLAPDSDYDLLVDVGPRWDKSPSIVTGSSEFPEEALPPSKDGGHVVRVVAASHDFTPQLVSGSLFLPAKTGRSTPIVNGRPAKTPGPLRLRLHTPKPGSGNIARLRLSLYYEGNLVQSGVASVSMGNLGSKAQRQNELLVDYVLSSSFQNLAETFQTRDLVVPGQKKGGGARVTLNLTLNDDGAAGHRIVVMNERAPRPAVLPYDTVAGANAMTEARQELLNLFFTKDEYGSVQQTTGLQGDHGKDLEQFKRDLFTFAKMGRRLFLGVFSSVSIEGDGGSGAQFIKKLEAAIEDATLIQVARTGPAQYVFPWAVLYSHGLTGDWKTWRYCNVIDEQWRNGRRSGEPLARCPDHKKSGDHDNVLCPFGFWGLRHIIEQPLSVLRKKEDGTYRLTNVAKAIETDGPFNVAVAVTDDPSMAADIKKHLASLGTRAVRLVPPNGALTATEAVDIFQTPEIVYILCHGKYDDIAHQPYLGIGANDQSQEHRIYPTTLQEWGVRVGAPNLSAWPEKRPLVIVNGCHTCDLLPGQMLTIVSALNSVGAGGVVGTEVSVQLSVAIEVAGQLFAYLTPVGAQGRGVGEALHRTRWDLANKGNLLGLAYTAYCMADLKLVAGGR